MEGNRAKRNKAAIIDSINTTWLKKEEKEKLIFEFEKEMGIAKHNK